MVDKFVEEDLINGLADSARLEVGTRFEIERDTQSPGGFRADLVLSSPDDTYVLELKTYEDSPSLHIGTVAQVSSAVDAWSREAPGNVHGIVVTTQSISDHLSALAEDLHVKLVQIDPDASLSTTVEEIWRKIEPLILYPPDLPQRRQPLHLEPYELGDDT